MIGKKHHYERSDNRQPGVGSAKVSSAGLQPCPTKAGLKSRTTGISSVSRKPMIPYGHQWIDEDDIQAVVDVLKSDWLTTGPYVDKFEEEIAKAVGTEYAVAVSNGTAALHAAIFAIGIKPGDEVIVSPMTFAASANCVVYQGGVPVFADVSPDTLLIDPEKIKDKITNRTRAIIAIDYAGQPCDYNLLRSISRKNGLVLISDACHSLGGSYKGRPVGSLADLNIFSFHPVKHITTGEGGMVTTDVPEFARRMRIFRHHGITIDSRQREQRGLWFYEMKELGYNYRLTDIQAALGSSQLRKLKRWVKRRREVARRYDQVFAEFSYLKPLSVRKDVSHAYHLYVVRLKLEQLKATRGEIFAALRDKGIGVNVHYIPVHLHPFYRNHYSTGVGMCPIAEAAYEQIISLPMFPALSDKEIDYVMEVVLEVLEANRV